MNKGTQPVLNDLGRMKRELTSLSGINMRIGVTGSADSDTLMIAAVHEYGCTIRVTPKMRAFLRYAGLHLRKTTGTINIPERSFIRKSYATSAKQRKEIVDKAIGGIIGGKTARQAAESVGVQFVQITKDYINSGKVKPKTGAFAQSQKSQHTTLVKTGRLANSITYEIEEGGR